MNYKKKYLKYKLKYLDIKYFIGGSNSSQYGEYERDRSPPRSEYEEHERDRSPSRSEYEKYERDRSPRTSEYDEQEHSSDFFKGLSGIYEDEELEESKKP